MRIVFDYPKFDPGDEATSEWADPIADEVKRIGGMIADGFTSGELVAGNGRGWWHIERSDPS